MTDRDPVEGRITGQIPPEEIKADQERREYSEEQTTVWRRNQATHRAKHRAE